MSPFILSERHGKVGLVRIERPQAMNALNDGIVDALVKILLDFDQDDGIGCMVITGMEKAFAAGADIEAMRDFDFQHVYLSEYVTRNWDQLLRLRKPLIAAVSGYALGGGCELAMICDMIYAAENARFGQPEIKLGFMPGAGGTQRLPRAVGKALAMDMCLSGRTIDAQEAQQAGLVARIFPTTKLLDETLAIARTIADYSLPMLMMIKESINRAGESSLTEGLHFERRMCHTSFALEDPKEGMAAFVEKRTPVFRNR